MTDVLMLQKVKSFLGSDSCNCVNTKVGIGLQRFYQNLDKGFDSQAESDSCTDMPLRLAGFSNELIIISLTRLKYWLM